MSDSFLSKLDAKKLLARLFVLVAIGYGIAILVMNFGPAMLPYAYEGDWKQWVWPYWRYHVEGAFPPGDLVTDYAFAVQPPAWRFLMGTASRIVEPGTAAIAFNILAYVIAVVAAAYAVGKRTNVVMGAASAMLLLRDGSFHRVTAGGYPRSFGPTLVLVFLAAWLDGRHRVVLAILLVQAALYPSVVLPCGLAYGLWVTWLAWKEKSPRKLIETVIVGAIVVVVGKSQDFLAADWWGHVVTAKEAAAMDGVFYRGGRVTWLPLPDYWRIVEAYVAQPFAAIGAAPLAKAHAWQTAHHYAFMAVIFVLALGVAIWRRAYPPIHLLILFATCLITYALAQFLAFKLYLPSRVPQHTLPYLTIVVLPFVVFCASRALLPTRPILHTAIAVWFTVGVTFLTAGHGLKPVGGYYAPPAAKTAHQYDWVQQKTPLLATFAGNLRAVDRMPLFGQRRVYVNWAMAHPFREGLWNEFDRRIRKTYEILYATSFGDVVTWCREEKIDYLIFDTSIHTKFESRGKGGIFEPARTFVYKSYFKPNEGKFALSKPPKQTIVARFGAAIVVDINALEAAVKAGADAALLEQPAEQPIELGPLLPPPAPGAPTPTPSPKSDASDKSDKGDKGEDDDAHSTADDRPE